MIEPEGTKVVVRADIEESISKGGIIIPEPIRDRHSQAGQTGVVEKIGPAVICEFHEVTEDSTEEEKAKAGLNVGDRILYPRYGGIALVRAGERNVKYRLLAHDDVLARISDDIEVPGESR
ncbi:MAG: co-chaperone GroES [FCB group bacterium]|nr:co-chaperone GroES [FCB group bacterium]